MEVLQKKKRKKYSYHVNQQFHSGCISKGNENRLLNGYLYFDVHCNIVLQ